MIDVLGPAIQPFVEFGVAIEKREAGGLGGGDDLGERSAAARGVGVDVQDADTLSGGGSSGEGWQVRKPGVRPDGKNVNRDQKG